MGSNQITLKLDERKVLGKGLGALRREGLIPAVVHNHGSDSVHAQGSAKELLVVYREAGKNHPVDIEVGSKKFLALIKDASFKPPKHNLQHIVFQAVKQDELVEAEVPVHIVGEIPAERLGLIVLNQLDSVLVEALPRDLPDELTVEGSRLNQVHDRLTVADLIAPEKVKIITEPEHAIATVVEPRAIAAEEEVEEVAEGEEAATTEDSDQKTENPAGEEQKES